MADGQGAGVAGKPMMKVLITGAFGFVGRNLSSHLAAAGHELWALDVAGPADVVPACEGGSYARRFDWGHIGEIPWRELDGVVHLAGKAHDTRCTADPQSYFDVNLGLTRTVLGALQTAGLSRPIPFVLFSSVKAIADSVDGVLSEEATPEPKTPYGQSKLAAERVVSALGASSQTPVKPFILRPCMIHGPGNKGNLNLLYNVVRKGLPWPLGAFDNRRSFASIRNVCSVVEGLLTSTAPTGAYHVADDETLSTNELIGVMASVLGRRPVILRLPVVAVGAVARLGDRLGLPLNSERLKKLTESYIVSNSKVKSALGWERMPMRAEEGLRLTVESFEAAKVPM